MFVVAGQVLDTFAAAAGGLREAERARRAAPPLAGAGSAQRAAAARRRDPRPAGARRGHVRRLRVTLRPKLPSRCWHRATPAHRIAPGFPGDAPWISLFMNLT